MASLRDSSMPVDSVSASVSIRSEDGSSPKRSTAISRMRRATSSFHEAVRAWPRSSMQVQMTAAPYSAARDRNLSRRVPAPSPSSRLTELSTGRPPMRWRAVSMTGASVESSTRGAVTDVAKRRDSSSMSATPSAPV